MNLLKLIIPGRAAKAFSVNLPNNCDKALNLFFIHYLALPPLILPDVVVVIVVVDTVGPPNKASIKLLWAYQQQSIWILWLHPVP